MRFIVVDGLDGSGKTTHAKLIRNRYLEKGQKVVLRSHPSDNTKYGEKTKKALLGRGKWNKTKASLYYALDVISSVQTGYGGVETLIFVRYLMGVAYLPLPLAKILYWVLTAFLPTSKYMFFLDLTPEESLHRMEDRDAEEMFENLEDLMKVRRKALSLTKDWNIIDTSGTIEEVQEKINKVLDRLDG
ncbi:thymidylate kinase [Methanobacterium aggregans]|uniref:thymidylate kinase n=1 Tax=Methanobacterium aggregans TaxID=1615586 RepID=UPI001AE9BEB6|nr:thymidylate kinase [Methanobacterium aggregans]MBP2046475.1 dTMP kinase [Methanobacterium aggregans]